MDPQKRWECRLFPINRWSMPTYSQENHGSGDPMGDIEDSIVGYPALSSIFPVDYDVGTSGDHNNNGDDLDINRDHNDNDDDGHDNDGHDDDLDDYSDDYHSDEYDADDDLSDDNLDDNFLADSDCYEPSRWELGSPVLKSNLSSVNATSDSDSDWIENDQNFSESNPIAIVLVSVETASGFQQRYREILRSLGREVPLMTVRNADQFDTIFSQYGHRICGFVVTDAAIMQPQHEPLTSRLAQLVARPGNQCAVVFAFDFAIQATTMPETFATYMNRNFNVNWKIRGVTRGRVVGYLDNYTIDRVPGRRYWRRYWLKRAVLLSDVDPDDRLLVLIPRPPPEETFPASPSTSSDAQESTQMSTDSEYFSEPAPPPTTTTFIPFFDPPVPESALRKIDVNNYLNDTPIAVREYYRESAPPESRPWYGYLGFVGYSKDHFHLGNILLGICGVWRADLLSQLMPLGNTAVAAAAGAAGTAAAAAVGNGNGQAGV
ncbi:hypothetical protein VTN77DRAFT_4588 [Rasamsonia byssochlamydoides]|uniref:uncharacterized protein n=1 Tax=Rasamsonia byssochlamydoides TaxID=89139 RepID=UPI003744AACF